MNLKKNNSLTIYIELRDYSPRTDVGRDAGHCWGVVEYIGSIAHDLVDPLDITADFCVHSREVWSSTADSPADDATEVVASIRLLADQRTSRVSLTTVNNTVLQST